MMSAKKAEFILRVCFLCFPEGSGATVPTCVETEVCVCGEPHSWLVPFMLSPPESLLICCIRRGNYVEAHQVPHTSFSLLQHRVEHDYRK